MTDPVKPRVYDGSRRTESARQNRSAVLAAAKGLLLSRGFAATAMADVADAAGVSVKNVYKVFGNKVGLAKAVFDFAIAGDDEPIPMIDRESLTKVRDEPEPRRKLERYGEHLALVAPRHVPMQLVILDAAAADPEAAKVWQQLQDERLHGMQVFADDLAAAGHLRLDVTPSDARDTLWTYTSAEIYRLLVLERFWPPERYGQWTAAALTAALLPHEPH